MNPLRGAGVWVVEGPNGVVAVYSLENDARVVAVEMLRRGEWARVTLKEIQ